MPRPRQRSKLPPPQHSVVGRTGGRFPHRSLSTRVRLALLSGCPSLTHFYSKRRVSSPAVFLLPRPNTGIFAGRSRTRPSRRFLTLKKFFALPQQLPAFPTLKQRRTTTRSWY